MLIVDQITELLGEVKPKKKTASVRQLEDLLRALKEVLLAVPSSPQINVTNYPLPIPYILILYMLTCSVV